MAFEYAKEFIDVEMPRLIELVFNNIYKEIPKVTQKNIIQYLQLCNWAIKMTRCKYKKQMAMVQYNMIQAKTQQQQAKVEFDLTQIAPIMQTAHFQLIYRILYREITRQKKKHFQVNLFHAGICLFQNYLDVIQDISISLSMSDRKNANVLMTNMFRHDIARIFKKGFLEINHEKILSTLIIVSHKFFKLLTTYSQGKILTIQTNKMLKVKRSKKERQE